MSDDPTITAAAGWEINFEGYKVKDKNALLKDAEKAKTAPWGEGDALMFAHYARLIKKWPFAGDPADVAAYDELALNEYKEVGERVAEALKSAIS